MRKLLYISIIALMAISCSTPLSKESYLEKFDTFTSEVSENYKIYSKKEWKKKTEEFEKFSNKWYKKFKADLTWQEEAKVTANKTKFIYYKALGQSSSAIKGLFDVLNVKEIKEKAQYYIDNNMENDLNQLYEEARKAGSAAEENVTEILKDLQVNVEKLKEKYDK